MKTCSPCSCSREEKTAQIQWRPMHCWLGRGHCCDVIPTRLFKKPESPYLVPWPAPRTASRLPADPPIRQDGRSVEFSHLPASWPQLRSASFLGVLSVQYFQEFSTVDFPGKVIFSCLEMADVTSVEVTWNLNFPLRLHKSIRHCVCCVLHSN